MSKNRSKTPYPVGYGRTPAHTRFKPGQSGNPAGRRKGQPSAGDLMLREAGRLVKIKNGGSVETATKHEVVIRQLWKLAMHGDLGAARLIFTFMEAALAPSEGTPQDETAALSLAVRPDDESLRRILKRFQHLQLDEGAQ